ncbi:MAG: bifunctional 3-deoxy-7-phosphoheptulonate synthase/chorismate mutase type II, partial [Muribaculaceae bacterium]|nr:bifunctional 3-deoxy-7-phosphoheptulonate synthase/chorismate mutase type II [Muribaculaceae bacterium]
IWKPRTKPGGFEGVGEQGLQWLRRVKESTGMLVATEVATRHHVEEAIKGGVDVLWVGARTSANPFAMQEIAEAISRSGGADKPVLVKNPVNPDLELWIGALQRLYNAGIRRLGAIHRGFSSTYGAHLYRNMPEWHIPIELRLRYSSLPIIVAPSHIGGRRELIAPLSQQALDMGFDGLMVESHCSPEGAWSDAAQQVTPPMLHDIVKSLVVRSSEHATERLDLLRQKIDMLDGELLEVLSKRLEVCREIGEYKREHRMSVVQPTRYNEMLGGRIADAAQLGLGEDFLRAVLRAIHDESVRQQIEVLRRKQ